MNALDYLLKKYSITFNEKASMPIEIPNVGRLDILRWLKELDFQTGAEIGVAEGEYSKLICETNPQMKIYGIDAWKPYKGYPDYTRRSTLDILFEEAQRRLSAYIHKGRYKIAKEFSMAAVKKFDDESLDFVFIDANHEEPFVYEDLTEWAKKVRVGGIVAGHDYVDIKSRIDKPVYGVRDALQRYTRDNKIRPWFVLGLSNETKGMIREGNRAWFFVK